MHFGSRGNIGGPQLVVQQLVAYGAVRGDVLDPGTGPGHHAIYCASQGFSTTGVDGSPSAIERVKRNAEQAGVQVDFQLADATTLEGFDGRFDTVVDRLTDMLTSNPGMAARFGPLQQRLATLEPLLENHRVHFPIWAVAATRLN